MVRALLFVLLLASPAFAQKAPHKEGEYGGVNPTGETRPEPGKPGKPRRPPPKGTLTWVGFEAKDGGAQVFLQSVAPFTVGQRLEGSTLVVSVDLSRLAGNTWRPIDTRFFDNPLARIVASKPKGKGRGKAGLEVRITFKNPKDAREGTVRSETGPDGMAYVYLTFPEGADRGAGAGGGTDEPDR